MLTVSKKCKHNKGTWQPDRNAMMLANFLQAFPGGGGCRKLGWRGWSHACSPGSGDWRYDQELCITFQVVGVEAVEVMVDQGPLLESEYWVVGL